MYEYQWRQIQSPEVSKLVYVVVSDNPLGGPVQGSKQLYKTGPFTDINNNIIFLSETQKIGDITKSRHHLL